MCFVYVLFKGTYLKAVFQCVVHYSYGSLQTSKTSQCIIWNTHKGWLIQCNNIQYKKRIYFIQTDTHFCLWDTMTHWLYNSITLRCFCTFHALRSRGNHRAATEGTPYCQAANCTGKSYKATLKQNRKKKPHTGEPVQEQTQVRSPSGTVTSGLSSVRCRLQQKTIHPDPHLKSCSACNENW